MPLAICIMHPQFEMMLQSAQAGALPPSGLLGLSGRLDVPLAIACGHLLWGTVLGFLYTHPVGYAEDRLPKLFSAAPAQGLASQDARPSAAAGFMIATDIECSYPTLEAGRWRMDEMAARGHYRQWRPDLALVRSMGLRYLRYGPPLHLIQRGYGAYDWSFLDDVTAEIQRLGIAPITDLGHFGLPGWLQNFQNPEVPHALQDYARAFARRYPGVRFYTPVNEMYVCARLSALDQI